MRGCGRGEGKMQRPVSTRAWMGFVKNERRWYVYPKRLRGKAIGLFQGRTVK